MKTLTLSCAILASAFLFGGLQVGCGDDETTTTGPSGPGGTGGNAGTGGTGGDAGSGGSAGGGFVFDETPYDQYVQVERHGAVEAGTVGIALTAGLGPAYPNAADPDSAADISIRDDYNASNPEEDAANMWLTEIGNSVTTLQTVLHDDLLTAGYAEADIADINDAVAQAGPVIIPDTIKYDPADPVGYPNGRALEDPVVDITIAAALLKLGPTVPITDLVGVLNPPENDVPFKTAFPYLADPH